jgi:hypothetical protein
MDGGDDRRAPERGPAERWLTAVVAAFIGIPLAVIALTAVTRALVEGWLLVGLAATAALALAILAATRLRRH